MCWLTLPGCLFLGKDAVVVWVRSGESVPSWLHMVGGRWCSLVVVRKRKGERTGSYPDWKTAEGSVCQHATTVRISNGCNSLPHKIHTLLEGPATDTRGSRDLPVVCS